MLEIRGSFRLISYWRRLPVTVELIVTYTCLITILVRSKSPRKSSILQPLHNNPD